MSLTLETTITEITNGRETLYFKESDLSKLIRMCKALSHPIQLKIIKYLVETNDKNKRTVTDIYCHLRCEQSIASQHLAKLKQGRLVYDEREGKYIMYSVDFNYLEVAEKLINEFEMSFRMKTAERALIDKGFIVREDGRCISFVYRGETVNFFPLSGYFSGKSLENGRGLKSLLNRVKYGDKN